MPLRSLLAPLLGASLVLSACSSEPEVSVPSSIGEPTAEVAGQGPATDAATEPEPTSSTAMPTDPTATPGGTPGSEPASPSSPATTNPSAPSSSTGVPSPVPAGTYQYATEGESQVGLAQPRPMPATTTLEAGRLDGQDHQLLTRDLRDDDGLGTVSTLDVQYGVEGVILHAITSLTTVEVFGSNVENGGTLRARPPTVIAPVDVQVGHAATLHLEGGDRVVDGTLVFRARETMSIAGASVDVFVVDVDLVFSGDTEGEQHSTWWMRVDDLLTVREETTLEATSQGVDYREEQTSQLRSLDPA